MISEYLARAESVRSECLYSLDGRPWEMSAAGKTRACPFIYETRRAVSGISGIVGCMSTDCCVVSIAGVTVTNSRGQTVLRVTPKEFPATSYRAQKESGDDTPIDYIQVGQLRT